MIATVASISTAPFWHCDGCGQPRHLFALVLGKLLCVRCWRRAGSPFPRSTATPQELHEIELATRERMNARGGADRHLVRSGKS